MVPESVTESEGGRMGRLDALAHLSHTRQTRLAERRNSWDFSDVELPFVASLWRGLFDPCSRSAPSQVLVPKRYTDPRCRIEDMVDVDAVVISYAPSSPLNLFKHTHIPCLTTFFKRTLTADLRHDRHTQGSRHILDSWEVRRIRGRARGQMGR
ncbi:hypothetical protein ARMGADRAFT_434546 [Armillaria gallica]|uniref:Uncharacterized protein n=1 Tax=Armillaria gallica TaxID=47427 RepID=A0A2H3CYW4_ARMGA|nr:hypothetical protein ARMGADRAFT_434546 [Armillaria gallica]